MTHPSIISITAKSILGDEDPDNLKYVGLTITTEYHDGMDRIKNLESMDYEDNWKIRGIRRRNLFIQHGICPIPERRRE